MKTLRKLFSNDFRGRNYENIITLQRNYDSEYYNSLKYIKNRLTSSNKENLGREEE